MLPGGRDWDRRGSSQSSRSTFEEVESLDLSHSSDSKGSRGSFSLGSRGSTGQSFDLDAMASLDQAALQRGVSFEGPRDPYEIMQGAYEKLTEYHKSEALRQRHPITKALARRAMLRKYYSADRQSRSSMSSSRGSRANSSWDEVESIDFGRSHEVDLDPAWFGPTDKGLQSVLQAKKEGVKQGKAQKQETATSSGTTSSVEDQTKDRSRKRRDLIVPDPEDDDEKFSSFRPRPENTGRGLAHEKEKRLVEQLLKYKNVKSSGRQNSPSESISTMSSKPNSHGSGEMAGKLPYENDYDYLVRMRRVSQGSLGSSVSGIRSGVNSRSTSLDSSMSFDSVPPEMSASPISVSPAIGGSAALKAARAAEDVLMSLGFVSQDSFIPERFARNWYDKMVGARRRQLEALQQQEIADMLEGLESPRVRHSERPSIPMRRHGNKSEFLHKLDVNSRNSSMRRSRFRRAATMVTFRDEGGKKIHKPNLMDDPNLETQSSLERQDSIDQLKFILERQASILNTGMDLTTKEHKRKHFAGSRQKSLPLCLETLSEEDEGRSSRAASFERSRSKSFREESSSVSRSSSKESDRSKHGSKRSSVGSDSSALPNSNPTSAECSDQEGEIDSLKQLDRFRTESLRNMPSGRSFEAPPRIGQLQMGFPMPGVGAMPLLQRQASLDNIQLGSYPAQLRTLGLSLISENPTSESFPAPISHKPEMTKSSSVPSRPVPAIVVSSHRFLEAQSSSSLEIADIFDRRTSVGSVDSLSEDEPVPGGGSRRASFESRRGSDDSRVDSNRSSPPKAPELKVEPAMISVNAVSLDVEEPPPGERRSSVTMLLAPSPSHNMITSPIPVSPVTVIEMDHLDNQDSMDSGDAPVCLGDSLPQASPDPPDSLHPIAEEEVYSSDQSHSTSFDDGSYLSDTAFSRYSSAKNSFEEQTPSLKDSGICADDGKLSPIHLYPNSVTFTSHLDAGTLKEAMNSRSDSFHSAQESVTSNDERRRQMSVEESVGTMSPRETRDFGMQGDDGTLSPIMFHPDVSSADYQLSADVYFACDKAIQCDVQDRPIGTQVTTASQTIFRWHQAHEGSSYQSFISREESFEPMCYFLNTSTQTDISGDHKTGENETVLVNFQRNPHFQMLCSHCRKSIQMSTSTDLSSKPTSPAVDVSKSLAEAHWKVRDSLDSVSGRKALDTIIERLSKKTNVIRQRSRSKSASFESLKNKTSSDFMNTNEKVIDKIIELKEKDVKEGDADNSEAKRTAAKLPRSPSFLSKRSFSDNFEHRRNKYVASNLAENDIHVVKGKSRFADSRNSSASGSVSAPASRNLSMDSRRSSTGAGTAGSRKGSLVRQQCIELSTVLLNTQDIHSRDLESGSDEEDVFAPVGSRGYTERKDYKEPLWDASSTVFHPEPEVRSSAAEHFMSNNPPYTRGNFAHLEDMEGMPHRFQRANGSKVRVQKKSRLKTKNTHPHLSSRSSSSLNASTLSSSKDSLDRDHLASSIATDLFQSIGIKPGMTKKQIMEEIAMDYLVMKAVNRTLDKLFSSSGELSDSVAQNTPVSRKTSGASTAASLRMTSLDSSDTNSELGYRGRDAYLKSAPQVGEAFSRLSTCDDGNDHIDHMPSYGEYATEKLLQQVGHEYSMVRESREGGAGEADAGAKSSDEAQRNASKQTSSASSLDGETWRLLLGWILTCTHATVFM